MKDERGSEITRLRAALTAIMFSLAACAHKGQMTPEPGAQASQGSGQAAADESGGVRVVAEAQRWRGDPATLSQYVFPVWMKIVNHSGKALWLGYSALRMEDPHDSQVRFMAVPPAKVTGKAEIPVSAAPPEIGLDDPWWGTSLEPDFAHYVRPKLHWEESLPTREMIHWAIKEGVVPDGRTIAGFVYFPKTKRDIEALTLRADLVDATTKQSFGRIDIPLSAVLN